MVYTCGDEIYFPRHRLKVLGQPLNWKNLYSVSESVESRKSDDSKRLNTGIVESIFVSIKWKILTKDKRIVWWDHGTNQWGWGSVLGRFGRSDKPDGALSEEALSFTVHIMEGGSYKIDYGIKDFGLLPSESYFSTGPSIKQKKLHYIFAKFLEGSAPQPNLFKNECPPPRQTGYNAYRGVFDFIDSEKFSLAGAPFDAEMARLRLGSKTTPKPRGNRAVWVNYDSLPDQAKSEGMTGKVWFTLVVNPEGRASACNVTQTSGWPILDQATCAMIMRTARFEPALDGLGEPTTGEYSSTVTWGSSE
jgi:TonB family protein